ncbi:enoyl-CoA hydratase/isomerase family protein [Pusillimonas sp. ANT_WB101]|uniref:enoyl-CoA hydratase/isomerase family protein n=1 Tax=Pusillimonas sp. ANT_WB101 TaxID=2597356 RepID=UPI0011ED69C6|nr:enoyl-CoA hydratase/isomerase family protein [Pusillimonas sp. ANT_WB101]KAA0911301.1 enoyl-CoA hydratase/isomerase family protein [Pusillimonas sp. ANT_WB101]
MSNDVVSIVRDDEVAIVTLKRPERMNAVNGQLRSQLTRALGALNDAPDVGAIVLTGDGDRAFCAGQDLMESAGMRWEDIVTWLHAQRDMYQAVRNLNKPCVAAINGVAAGAGFQLALCADIRVIAPETRIGQPEVKAGLASIVGSYLMTLYVGLTHNVAMSLTGDLITGQRAYDIGLVTELADADKVLSVAVSKAHEMAALPATAVRVSKQRFREMTQSGFDDAVLAGVRAQLECYAQGEPQRFAERFLGRSGRSAG